MSCQYQELTPLQVAREAGGGATPIKEFDRGGQAWHYHTAGRSGGHILYGLAGALTFAHYAKGQGAANETAAEIADLANPLSLGQDVLDIYTAIRQALGLDDLEPTHLYRGPCGELYGGRNPPSGYTLIY